ncbi:glycosyltransferase family 2 protein [Halomonas sp. 18071143]|uniref:glycosyltransferase family 2 protein n=1 Tax=Halomonas sp. 18071143 TaxID=2855441 RepID=UPI00210AC240|nr:glycosyltransferase family 2 protein [Halomonas sp. 18071143]
MIVIPMAGLSSRFFKEGYELPKHQLPLFDRTVFQWVMKSFQLYFETDYFVFIVRDDYDNVEFINNELAALGVVNHTVVVLNAETRGQADTVYLGLSGFDLDSELYIFNIDTIRWGFVKPDFIDKCSGYLEVFEGEGDHWSFVLSSDQGKRVLKTTEKDRVSNLCSDGLYYFSSLRIFNQIFEEMEVQGGFVKGELYVAPMYNYLIEKGLPVLYDLIDKSKISFCGTPAEYVALLDKADIFHD